MKFTIITVSLSALVAFAAADTCASTWGQCGGKNYKNWSKHFLTLSLDQFVKTVFAII